MDRAPNGGNRKTSIPTGRLVSRVGLILRLAVFCHWAAAKFLMLKTACLRAAVKWSGLPADEPPRCSDWDDEATRNLK